MRKLHMATRSKTSTVPGHDNERGEEQIPPTISSPPTGNVPVGTCNNVYAPALVLLEKSLNIPTIALAFMFNILNSQVKIPSALLNPKVKCFQSPIEYINTPVNAMIVRAIGRLFELSYHKGARNVNYRSIVVDQVLNPICQISYVAVRESTSGVTIPAISGSKNLLGLLVGRIVAGGYKTPAGRIIGLFDVPVMFFPTVDSLNNTIKAMAEGLTCKALK
jgi:hypothetical protein